MILVTVAVTKFLNCRRKIVECYNTNIGAQASDESSELAV